MLKHLSNAAGIDEAGRGPLAGPVLTAAVFLPDGFDSRGLDDSKKMTPKAREEWSQRIKDQALWAISRAEPEAIDRLNVLQATMLSMVDSAVTLMRKVKRHFGEGDLMCCLGPDEYSAELIVRGRSFPSKWLVDGNCAPKGSGWTPVVKGDGIYACIAAASVLAKVERDRIMTEYAAIYPEYGFDSSFGYPTPFHLKALHRYGPCPIHRRSFSPVKAEKQPCLMFEE